MERCTAAGLAFNPDLAGVIRDDRLDDGQPEPRSVLLGGVVRREDAAALLLGQAFTSVAELEPDDALAAPRTDRHRAAGRHRVERVEQQVLADASELIGVGANRAE